MDKASCSASFALLCSIILISWQDAPDPFMIAMHSFCISDRNEPPACSLEPIATCFGLSGIEGVFVSGEAGEGWLGVRTKTGGGDDGGGGVTTWIIKFAVDDCSPPIPEEPLSSTAISRDPFAPVEANRIPFKALLMSATEPSNRIFHRLIRRQC